MGRGLLVVDVILIVVVGGLVGRGLGCRVLVFLVEVVRGLVT